MVLSDDAKNAMLQGLANKLNTGSNALLSVYVGATLAAEITLPNPVQASITNAVMTFKVPPKVLAIASGTPTGARVLDANGALIATLDVATELVLDKASIYAGGYVTLTALTMGI